MADKKIEEVDHDTDITGTEKIPMSDGNVAKYATTEDLMAYVISEIQELEAASDTDVSTDSLYLLQDGVLKPISEVTVAQAVMDYGFGLAGVSEITGNEIVSIKDSSTRKTMTTAQLKAWIASNGTIPWDELEEPTATYPLADADYLVWYDTSASATKKVKIADYDAYVHAAFLSYVQGLDAIDATIGEEVNDTDLVYLVHSDSAGNVTARKATVAQLLAAAGFGDVTGPDTTTENKIPQWDSAQKTLKDGLAVVTSVSTDDASDTNIPTESAVSNAIKNISMDGIVNTSSDQTIDGTKTFKISPVVPDVSSTSPDNAVATKKYVDSVVPTNVVNLTDDQTVGGTKTFSSSPVVPSPSEDNEAANKEYVDGKIPTDYVDTTSDQTIAGVKGFSSSPTVPYPTLGTQVANKNYVDDQIVSDVVRTTTNQTISGIKTFAYSPVVPDVDDDDDDADGYAVNKGYVDGKVPSDYVNTSGDQEVGGTKTFSVSPIVPTASDDDDSTKAASTAFVKRMIELLPSFEAPRFPIVEKTVSSNAVTFDDCAINVITLATGSTTTATMPDKTEGYSRSFIVALNATGTSGTITLNLEGGTFYAETETTFTITPGMVHIIGFTEDGTADDLFRVSRRTFNYVGTAFTGTI